MNDYIGQNPEEVDQLAQLFADKASQVTQLQHSITAKLQATTWTGPDRDRFENEWTGPAAGFINQVVAALGDAHDAASANATAQRQASGVA